MNRDKGKEINNTAAHFAYKFKKKREGMRHQISGEMPQRGNKAR